MPPPEHDDPDERTLRAIRSPGPADAPGPGPASADEAQLARLGGIVRSLSDDDMARNEPPPHLWAGIAERTGHAVEAEPAGPPRPAPPADLLPLRRTRRRRPGRVPILVGAAAAAAVLVVIGVSVAREGDDNPVVVASARLEPLPDQPAGDARPVDARVVEHDGGLQLDLDLDDSGLPPPAGFYEVWLIEPNIEGMVSLGPARADGTYTVPSDIDVAAFPIVDVSVEPPDGVPTHSTVSVLRGTLA
jgi:hypothetical protein